MSRVWKRTGYEKKLWNGIQEEEGYEVIDDVYNGVGKELATLPHYPWPSCIISGAILVSFVRFRPVFGQLTKQKLLDKLIKVRLLGLEMACWNPDQSGPVERRDEELVQQQIEWWHRRDRVARISGSMSQQSLASQLIPTLYLPSSLVNL
ncbi:hypothetical protein ANN_19745 [Periplaneta americana]|uniref:Uncharacterized protein n=1 Tax=Periplaneta americana TaxID=6978 RepID=A0ABQ8SBE2_PERAM|nr:hypothetical protein ANN_19745 [Periplaneta americana]